MSTESGMVLVPRELLEASAAYLDGRSPSLAHRLESYLAAAPASPPTPEVDGRTLCGWTEDADGIWESDCGQTWSFVDGGPHDNRCAFCNKCGKPLDIVAYVEEKETEE